MYEKKPGDLAVFKNNRKEKETHPDYTIVGLGLNGEKIKGALWLKTDRNGGKFMAGKIEVDDYEAVKKGTDEFRGGSSSGVASRDRGGSAHYDLNDDVPFVRMAVDGEV